MKRDFITIDDLSDAALRKLMSLADELRRDLRGQSRRLDGFLLGSLFLEPSTRTRLSFEAAMARLGGRVITSSDPATSSAVKGESLADTVRIVDSYVDVTVLRHPLAGAARLAARLAVNPVINAGDGAHEHPTQTLCDLYALQCEKGGVEGLTVVLYGDLKFGRTVHSLSRALVRMGASVLAIAEEGLGLPDSVVRDLRARPSALVRDVVIRDMEAVFHRRDVRALWCGPRDAWRRGGGSGDPEPFDLRGMSVDAIYVTRLQKERLSPGSPAARALPILDHRFMESEPFSRAVVLHPLPRVGEIAPEMDRDPRAAYFRQAALGVPIRMALLLWACGAADLPGDGRPEAGAPLIEGYRCGNPRCITASAVEGVSGEVAGGSFDQPPHCLFCEEPAMAV